MKLLVTGAAHFNEEQLNTLASLGFEIIEQKDESAGADIDYSSIDAAVLNGLFLYHDISEFDNLKFIQLTSAGLDRVPVDDIIADRGIKLFNAKGVYSVPMAEYAVTGVLALYKKLNCFYDNQKNHSWIKDRTVKELAGSTVAVIGCGSVGTECAKRFKAFDIYVIGVDLIKPEDSSFDEFVFIDGIENALPKADVVILTLPLTPQTEGMFGKKLFSCFKKDSVLVNIARGKIVNEADLINALNNGSLGGAVLDVFENEPLEDNSELWNMKNVIVTPHNSFVSPKNSERLFNLTYKNLKEFVEEEK